MMKILVAIILFLFFIGLYAQKSNPIEGTFLSKNVDSGTLFLFSKDGKVYYFAVGGALNSFSKGSYTIKGSKVTLSFPPEEKNMFTLYASHNAALKDSIKIEYMPNLTTEEHLHFMTNNQVYLLETPTEHNSQNPLVYSFLPSKKINEMLWFVSDEALKEYGFNAFIANQVSNYNSFKIFTQRDKLITHTLEKIDLKWDGKKLSSNQLQGFVYKAAPKKDNSKDFNDFEEAYTSPNSFEEDGVIWSKIPMQVSQNTPIKDNKTIILNYKMDIKEEQGAIWEGETSSPNDTSWMDYFPCDLADGFYLSSTDENEVWQKEKAKKIQLNIKEFYIEDDAGFIFIKPNKDKAQDKKIVDAYMANNQLKMVYNKVAYKVNIDIGGAEFKKLSVISPKEISEQAVKTIFKK